MECGKRFVSCLQVWRRLECRSFLSGCSGREESLSGFGCAGRHRRVSLPLQWRVAWSGGDLLHFAVMTLTRQQVFGWAASDILEAGQKLFSSGAVQGVQARENLLAGSLKLGASRFVVRLLVGAGAPRVQCPCSVARSGKVCCHAVAVALQWVKQSGGEEQEPTVFAAERAPTRLEIEKWAGPSLMARAEGLVKRGAVSRVGFHYPVGQGLVASGGGALLATFRMLENGLVEGKCPCFVSRDQGLLCEHIIAVALGVMHQFGSAEHRRYYAEERAHAARLAGAKGMIARGAGGAPARIRVFLPSDVPGQFAQGAVRVAVRIFVDEKPFKPQELPPVKYTFPPGDEVVMSVLEDLAGGPFMDLLTLPAADFLSVLRCGMRCWIGFAANKQRLAVAETAVDTSLMLEARPEESVLALKLLTPPQGQCLVAGHQGFWFTQTGAAPLARTLPTPFHSLYRQEERIPRERVADFFHAEWPMLTAQLPVDSASVTPDMFSYTPGTPRFRLELTGSEVSVAAKLRVGYGAVWVTAGVPQEISEPDPEDFYHAYGRNLEAEQTAMDRVRQMGFCGSRGDDLGAIVGSRAVLNLLGTYVPALHRDGWEVALSGPVETLQASAKMLVPRVSIRSSADKKTFDVSVTYVSTDGSLHASPAEVEQALAYGNAYIEHKDGPLLLDIGAVRTLRETLQSCHAKRPGAAGAGQVAAIHAPFVQAALERLSGVSFEAEPDWKARAAAQNRRRAPEPVPLGSLETILRPYQKAGVYWLRFLEECGFCGILADEMGLGKTLQTLTWLHLPRSRETARGLPSLIVCPTSLVENWRREAEKFVPGLRCLTLSGTHRAAAFAQVPDCDLVITSYALIRRDIAFHAQARYAAVILDEAQAIKNQRTQNALAVKQLQADTRLVLSGTPIENSVADLWSIMDFLMPHYLGSYSEFQVAYEDPVAQGGAVAERAQERLRDKLHPFLLRRQKKDVAKDLPDKIRSVMYCELTPAQRAVYEPIHAEVRASIRGLAREKGERSKFEMLAQLMRLRQICCDLRLLKQRSLKPGEAPSAKLDALMDCLSEARSGGHRMLVFSQFTSMLRLIAQRLEEEQIPYCYLDGATHARLEECARFNRSPEIPLFLISLKAGGTGLNLTGADMVVHFDPWWNPAAEEQATDRAHRIGQKKTVQVIKLIAQDTIEEKVLQLQKKKQSLIQATINVSDASFLSTLTIAEIEDLLA